MMEELYQRRRMKTFAQNFLYFGVFLLFISIGISAFLLRQAFAAVPPSIITYQGKILENGASVTTSKQMYFVLYDDAVAGSAVYSASGTTGLPSYLNITPTQGLFTVNFGDTGTNAVDPTIFRDNSVLYLEVRIGAQTLSPRKRITASPFAINSKYLDGFEATSTAPASVHIPVSDSSGNFVFNFVSSTGLDVNGDVTISGNVTTTGYIVASTSFRGNLYCDVNGLHCFNPTSGWGVVTQMNTTTWTSNGNFSHGGKVGYQAANDACNTEFAGSHFCFTGEIIYIIATQNISYFGGNAWIAEGPPGYTANSNDCNGYTSSLGTYLGAFWDFNATGGGMGWLVNCGMVKPVACCQ